MAVSGWIIAAIITKLMIYVGAASAIGGACSALLFRSGREHAAIGLGRVSLALISLGMAAAIVDFFIQVGNFSETGLAGMVDGVIIAMLWDSPVGSALVLKVGGMLLPLVAILAVARRSYGSARFNAGNLLLAHGALAGALLLGYGFILTGHSADLGGWASLAIALHTVAALWWIGSLYPLWWASSRMEIASLRQVLHRFGRIATGVVAVLALAGGLLLYLLLDSPRELLTTGYGRALCAKLTAVVVILLLAARHKYLLVPRLADPRGLRTLRNSIAVEGLVAAVILAITAVLSTALGPASLS